MALTPLDQRFPAKVEDLIERHGVDAVLIKNLVTHNTDTDTVTLGADDRQELKCTPPKTLDQRHADGKNLLLTDQRVTIAGSAVTDPPAVQDRFEIFGEVLRIVSVIPQRSGELVAAYKLFLRAS